MLSIRTQDKMALVPYEAQIKIYKIAGGRFKILLDSKIDEDFDIILGIYSTEKRTLEVLDEIENAIRDSQITLYEYYNSGITGEDLIQYTFSKRAIYQMPER